MREWLSWNYGGEIGFDLFLQTQMATALPLYLPIWTNTGMFICSYDYPVFGFPLSFVSYICGLIFEVHNFLGVLTTQLAVFLLNTYILPAILVSIYTKKAVCHFFDAFVAMKFFSFFVKRIYSFWILLFFFYPQLCFSLFTIYLFYDLQDRQLPVI